AATSSSGGASSSSSTGAAASGTSGSGSSAGTAGANSSSGATSTGTGTPGGAGATSTGGRPADAGVPDCFGLSRSDPAWCPFWCLAGSGIPGGAIGTGVISIATDAGSTACGPIQNVPVNITSTVLNLPSYDFAGCSQWSQSGYLVLTPTDGSNWTFSLQFDECPGPGDSQPMSVLVGVSCDGGADLQSGSEDDSVVSLSDGSFSGIFQTTFTQQPTQFTFGGSYHIQGALSVSVRSCNSPSDTIC